MKNDFLATGNHFFLPLSDTAATACFIFPSDGRKRIFKRVLQSN